MMAGSVVTVIPVLVLFLRWRSYIRGVLMGASKGGRGGRGVLWRVARQPRSSTIARRRGVRIDDFETHPPGRTPRTASR
jgi:hypothetical protein